MLNGPGFSNSGKYHNFVEICLVEKCYLSKRGEKEVVIWRKNSGNDQFEEKRDVILSERLDKASVCAEYGSLWLLI